MEGFAITACSPGEDTRNLPARTPRLQRHTKRPRNARRVRTLLRDAPSWRKPAAMASRSAEALLSCGGPQPAVRALGDARSQRAYAPKLPMVARLLDASPVIKPDTFRWSVEREYTYSGRQ